MEGEPIPGQPGLIDRGLLLDLVQKEWGFSLPEKLLPEMVEFVQMGAKLLIRDGQVRVVSGNGPVGRALITIRVFGQDIPLLADLDQSYPLEPLLKRAADRAVELKSRIQKRLATMPATRPVGG